MLAANQPKLTINKKPKLKKDDLEKLTNAELIDKIVQLEAHNLQLKNIIEKKFKSGIMCKNTRKQKVFDFKNTNKRHLLLKFLYFGWDYQGYACQEDTTDTIEYNLFDALIKTCLIESRESSNYHRCGRTDKEVSAYCQVISIDLRSKYIEADQMLDDSIENELDYCKILNNVLPSNIRCLGWMPLCNKSYSARFDCDQRTYRYFFPKGNLDIESMRKACSFLIGTHDFRNLCKMDVANGVTNFVRTITSADIDICQSQIPDNTGYEMYNFKITGQAFLWHQIRCIMGLLLLVGEKNEEFSVIPDLLDINKNPRKPQYSLASGQALNLYCCEFRSITEPTFEETDRQMNPPSQKKYISEWIYKEENLKKLIENLQEQWTFFNIRTTMIREVIFSVKEICITLFGSSDIRSQTKNLHQGVKSKIYQKLFTRKRCESLENRLEHYIKKQRLIVNKSNNQL